MKGVGGLVHWAWLSRKVAGRVLRVMPPVDRWGGRGMGELGGWEEPDTKTLNARTRHFPGRVGASGQSAGPHQVLMRVKITFRPATPFYEVRRQRGPRAGQLVFIKRSKTEAVSPRHSKDSWWQEIDLKIR